MEKGQKAQYYLDYKKDLQNNLLSAIETVKNNIEEIRCGEAEKEFSIIIYCSNNSKTINISKDDKALNCISPSHHCYDD